MYFFIYFLLINLIALFSMYLDKMKAKKHLWRIPENTLFLFAILGGSLGSIMGMQIFRHKTKHLKFIIGMPLILFLQAFLLIYYFQNIL